MHRPVRGLCAMFPGALLAPEVSTGGSARTSDFPLVLGLIPIGGRFSGPLVVALISLIGGRLSYHSLNII